MWNEDYEKLSTHEKGEFERIGNYLLSRSFLVKDRFDNAKSIMTTNDDYRMACRFFNLMQNYFEVIGWKLAKDNEYNVISIQSIYDHNRLRLNEFTTLFLYTLRLIYEEEREKINSHKNIRTETQTVIEKMMALGVLKRKTTQKERLECQRALEHHNIIQKTESKWSADGNHLIILPSILHIISNQGINDMIGEIENMKKDETANGEIDNTEDDFESEENNKL